MEPDLIRDYLVTAAIFGLFSFSWFGWAQEKPPKSWVVPLGIASAIGLIVACIGGYLASQNWNSPSALSSDSDYMAFGVIVAIEVASMLIGSLVLLRRHKTLYIPSWIAFVVGVHFVPFASIFQDPWYYLLAVLTIIASLVPLAISKRVGVSVVTLTGALVGTVIFLFALRGLVLYALA